MLDTNAQHHFVEDLTTRESDEPTKHQLASSSPGKELFVPSNIRVIQVGDLAVPKRVDGIPVGLLVEGRTRDRSRGRIANSIDQQVSKSQWITFPFW